MYKMLLCLRYLRTRYIALASIISVMLGVATMIVVNSVMCGFQSEMHKRLHGILSDVVVEAHSMEGIQDPVELENEIRGVLGDDLVGLTSTVHIPAMLSFQVRGQWMTKQVNLIGIDERSYANVSEFGQYLLHPKNREQLSFDLYERGYDSRLREAGWTYRRMKVAQERYYREQMEKLNQSVPAEDANESAVEAPETDAVASSEDGPFGFEVGSDPFDEVSDDENDQRTFDAATQQHVGIVLGIATSNIRHRTPEGEIVDLFLCKPGDDVKVTFPTAGTPPQAVSTISLFATSMKAR